MFENLPEFMTIEQVARVLQLGRSTMYALTVEWDVTGGKSGMPFVWFGRQKRIPKPRSSASPSKPSSHPPRDAPRATPTLPTSPVEQINNLHTDAPRCEGGPPVALDR